ncbi:MAG: carboxypeptidase regulatory-like domain-containing protein [Flavobacteriales bacterium]|nr:carboxypeptidase regulatory-like domain-containing protein [Flavobacteriales bacterium]MCB9167943.1 carboxypeptidase regulatory-like domain-containing protein [Flavobacteriales bacterium]
MKKHLLPGLLMVAMGWRTPALAAHLRVTGIVTSKITAAPVPDALVRIYKDGVKQHILHTGPNGRYDVVLDNNADYVIRFSLPGQVTKCFSVDTHGPAWEGDNTIKEVFVEMTLFDVMPDMDLSFFDLPMGMARFDPMTGYLTWDEEYDERIRPEVQRLMDAYERILLERTVVARNYP